jgi:hypothetical protein
MTRCIVRLLIVLALVPLVASRAAAYADEILNGVQPGDLPLARPMTFELVLNLKTAQAARTPGAGNICHGWTLVGWGTKLLPAYPNYPFTEYWLWTAAQDKRSKPMAFRIAGQYPYARFSSFQTYSPTHTVALLHADIIPDEGSVNPTRIGADRYAENRSYTVWFVPAGSARAGKPNTIVMPADMSATNLILRILRPDKDKPHGGVPLPTIEAFDEMTGESVACPRKTPPTGVFRPLSIRKLLAAIPSPQDPISVYRFTGERYVPNQEAKFLAARLDFPYERKIAALRFKIPTFPDTYSNPATVITGKEDTRYTGICVHGLIGTLTSECLADDELKKDPEGFANIIVGPEDKTLRHMAEARGYNYLSWKRMRAPLIAYRQVFPRDDFAGSIDKVPVYDPNLPNDQQRAENFMGPYAPIGRVCSAKEFLAGSNCGLPTLSSSAQ